MTDTAIIEAGAEILRFQMIGVVFEAVIFVSVCAFQSEGKAASALLLSSSRQGIVFAIVLVISASAFAYTGILLTQAVSDLITVGMAIILMRREAAVRNDKKLFKTACE